MKLGKMIKNFENGGTGRTPNTLKPADDEKEGMFYDLAADKQDNTTCCRPVDVHSAVQECDATAA